jgi:uncharacterized membrane protein
MNDVWLFALRLVSALGCGLIAGVFFAFSTFVMTALARRPPAEGMAAMQAINVDVLNPWFLTVFVGTAVTSLLVVISSVLRWQDPGALYGLLGGVTYIAGTFLVTMVFNVPLNDALAKVAPADPGSAGEWARYVATWTAWNHVRTAAALAAAAMLIIALWQSRVGA